MPITNEVTQSHYLTDLLRGIQHRKESKQLMQLLVILGADCSHKSSRSLNASSMTATDGFHNRKTKPENRETKKATQKSARKQTNGKQPLQIPGAGKAPAWRAPKGRQKPPRNKTKSPDHPGCVRSTLPRITSLQA